MWIDVSKKEQSRASNELGEEVLAFLKRYGVRMLRYPQMQTASSLAEFARMTAQDKAQPGL